MLKWQSLIHDPGCCIIVLGVLKQKGLDQMRECTVAAVSRLSNTTRTLNESVALLSSRSVLVELPESELLDSEFSENSRRVLGKFSESSRQASLLATNTMTR